MPRLNQSQQIRRIKKAVASAAACIKALGTKSSLADLAEALLLEGILSGDIRAAAFASRNKLQTENLRLRQRIALTKLRTEEIKRKVAEIALQASKPKNRSPEQVLIAIRNVYGLTLAEPQKALPDKSNNQEKQQ